MSADKSKAARMADWLDARVSPSKADRQAIAAELRRLSIGRSELGTLCFHIEQAIENGCCPYDIEAAYASYVAATQSK